MGPFLSESRHALYLAVLAASLGACNPSGEARMIQGTSGIAFDKIEYTFDVDPFMPNTLTIEPSGSVRYKLHDAPGYAGTPEIGTYETALTLGEIDRLKVDLKRLGYEDIRSHENEMSGDQLRTIVVVQGAEEHARTVGTRDPVDPRFEQVVACLDEIAAKTMAHPHQALRLRVLEFAIADDRRATVTVELASIGTRPVDGPPPAKAGGAWFALRLFPDVPWDQRDSLDMLYEKKIDAVELDVSPDHQKPGPVVEIPNQGAKTFRFIVDLRQAKARASEATIFLQSYLGSMRASVKVVVPPLRATPPNTSGSHP